jgi:hypothetical protein
MSVPEVVADSVKSVLGGLRCLVQDHPDRASEIIQKFNQELEMTPLLARPRERSEKTRRTGEKGEEFDANAFLLKMRRWSTASASAITFPTEVTTRLVRDMDEEHRGEFLAFAKVILDASEQLEKIVEGVEVIRA